MFTGQPQDNSTRHEQPQARSKTQQIGEQRGGSHHLLKVVEHEQALLLVQGVLERCQERLLTVLDNTKGCSNRDQYQVPTSRMGARSTKVAPFAKLCCIALATARARRVLPVPPGTVRVSRRTPNCSRGSPHGRYL